MKRKLLVFGVLYYPLMLLIFAVSFKAFSLLPALLTKPLSAGTAVVFSYLALFIGAPLLVILLTRFSMLRWYVDPIAAIMIPAYIYFSMILTQTGEADGLRAAFLLVNDKLSDDGGIGWMLFAALFLFGLASSFSIARTKGKSISYRLVDKLSKNGQHTENADPS